jgi:hypothetical protein
MASSRREFLKSAGAYSAVAGVGLTGGLGLGDAAPADAYAHPFGYPEGGLQVERTRRLGYEGYKGIVLADGRKHSGCAFGVFHGIVAQLAEVVGEPYAGIPTQMMDWGSGGVVGFGSLCGTLNGAAAAIGLICDGDDARGFISDLLTWYSATPSPTNLVAPTGDTVQTTAESNLCHISVTRWCAASGFASGSPERADRCARMAGDVAAKAVEMLNGGRLGLEVPGEKAGCRNCHYMGESYATGQFTHGAMDCLTCHTPHK